MDQKQRSDPEYLVVMTASIVPAAKAQIGRTDPRVRLEDYKAALRFWLRHPHPKLRRILFLENSGADLDELRSIGAKENSLGKDVEFVSMHGNRIPEGFHYGYGDMQMLDEGLAQSRLRCETTHMIKVTGRLTFPKIGKLMDRLPAQFDVYVECRIPTHSYRAGKNPLGVLRRREGAYTTCQLMIFSHEFYAKELQKLYPNLQPGYPGSYPHLIESLIYDRVIEFEGQQGVYLRWPINVEPAGYAGHASKRYEHPARAVIRGARALIRVIAPGIWF